MAYLSLMGAMSDRVSFLKQKRRGKTTVVAKCQPDNTHLSIVKSLIILIMMF